MSWEVQTLWSCEVSQISEGCPDTLHLFHHISRSDWRSLQAGSGHPLFCLEARGKRNCLCGFRGNLAAADGSTSYLLLRWLR